MNETNPQAEGKTCSCSHHKMVPVIVILLGLAFLLEAMGALSAGAVSYIWPILVIVGGVLKLASHKCKCC